MQGELFSWSRSGPVLRRLPGLLGASVAIFGMTAFSPDAHAVTKENIRIDVASTTQRIFKDSVVIGQPSPSVELWVARNEYESAQLALFSEEPVVIRKVTANTMVHENKTATIDAGSFAYGFPAYVYVTGHTAATPREELDGRAPGWFPDPLEMGGSMKLDGAGSLWVRWHIPAGARPGTYRGNLRIETATGVKQVPVTLHVWNFTLPDRPSMRMTNWVYIDQIEQQYGVTRGSEKFWRIVEAIADDLAAHRQDVIFTQLGLIRSMMRDDGGYDFDFSLYGKWVKVFLDRGFRIFEGSHLFHRNSHDIRRSRGAARTRFAEANLATAEGRRYLEALLPALHRENARLGIAGRYMQHVGDEVTPDQRARYREVAAMVRKFMPGVPIIDATHLSPSLREGMMDIPVVNMGKPRNEAPGMEAMRDQWGSWWYTAAFNPRGRYPNRFIDYPLIKMRMIPWVSWLKGKNYLHYAYNFWHTPSKRGPWRQVQYDKYAPGDGWIVYPPKSRSALAPVPSLRWEVLRDGMEDFEYMRLLERLAGGQGVHAAAARGLLNELRAAVRSPEDYPRDAQWVENMRRRMGVLLDRAAADGSPGESPIG